MAAGDGTRVLILTKLLCMGFVLRLGVVFACDLGAGNLTYLQRGISTDSD